MCSCDKQTDKFLVAALLRDRFLELRVIKKFLEIDKAPPKLEKSTEAAPRFSRELPTHIEMESIPPMEISSLAENIHAKTREALQNTDRDMQELLKIDKSLKAIQGELVNNASKLTEINERIKVEDDPTCSEEQKQLSKDRL